MADVKNTSSEETSLKEQMTNVIQSMFCDEEYGFEVYIVMKTDPPLKHFNLSEGRPIDRNNVEKNLKKKVQKTIEKTIVEKFCRTEKEYDKAENVAANQNVFYVTAQTAHYKPFEIITMPINCIEGYHANERKNARGALFRFEKNGTIIWAYQKFYIDAIPNRKGNGFHIVPSEGDVFEELKSPILLLTGRIDVLIVDNNIICDNVKYMEQNLGFEEFIICTASQVVQDIQRLNLVSNIEKVIQYIGRGKLCYAKKMMRIKDSPILKMSVEDIYEKIVTLQRWQGKFNLDEENKKIVLKSYKQVEHLIDLLDERFMRSEVTNEEYDIGMGAKKRAITNV